MQRLYMPEFEHDDKRYRIYYDESHETRGSYGYATEAETCAAEEEEIANLMSGKWVVVGIVTYEKHEVRCGHCCTPWVEKDSVWGCVIEDSEQKVREYAIETM